MVTVIRAWRISIIGLHGPAGPAGHASARCVIRYFYVDVAAEAADMHHG